MDAQYDIPRFSKPYLVNNVPGSKRGGGGTGLLVGVAGVGTLIIIYLIISTVTGEWKFWKWFTSDEPEPEPELEPEPEPEPEQETPPPVTSADDIVKYITGLGADAVEALKLALQSEIDGFILTDENDRIGELQSQIQLLDLRNEQLYADDIDDQKQIADLNAEIQMKAAEISAAEMREKELEASLAIAQTRAEFEANKALENAADAEALQLELGNRTSIAEVAELRQRISDLEELAGVDMVEIDKLNKDLEDAIKIKDEKIEALKIQTQLKLDYKNKSEIAEGRIEALEETERLAAEVQDDLAKELVAIRAQRDALISTGAEKDKSIQEATEELNTIKSNISAKEQKIMDLEEKGKEDSKKYKELESSIEDLNKTLEEVEAAKVLAEASVEEAQAAMEQADADAQEAFEQMLGLKGELDAVKSQLDDLAAAPEVLGKKCMFGIGKDKNTFIENGTVNIRCGYALQYSDAVMACDDPDKELACAYKTRDQGTLPLLFAGKSINGKNCTQNITEGIKHGYCMKPYSLTKKQYDSLPVNTSGEANAKWGINRCENASDYPICYDTTSADMKVEGADDINTSVTIPFPFGENSPCPYGSFYACRPKYNITLAGPVILDDNKISFSLSGFPAEFNGASAYVKDNYAIVAQLRVGSTWIIQITRTMANLQVPVMVQDPFISFNANLTNEKKNIIKRSGKIDISYYITRKGKDGNWTKNDNDDQGEVTKINNVAVLT